MASSTAAGQTWNAANYERHARFVAELGAPVLDLLEPKPGEAILDLACGDGALTERIAAAGAAVRGCDASPELLEAARARGLSVDLVDGHALPYDAEFDAVFSNAALHWMTRPREVAAGVRRALRPGGRFVGEFGGFGNVAAIVTALIAVLQRHGIDGAAAKPWYNPTASEYAAVLEEAGFSVVDAWLVPRPTPLPTGMAGWLQTFADPFVRTLPPQERASALDETVRLLAPSLCDAQGQWIADYVRLRFKATL
ncbi:MAG TPA: methyltransferase domain-containing protein [Burkholderiaceae bacterium]|nr:methyltransferase domain-containing protein [Burkholderiaceae bacterium]